YDNVGSAAELRALTDALQAAVAAPAGTHGSGPLLIAADQEGGQLVGLGDDSTAFAGAMALGAAADVELAERVARATGREMRALGVNVNYAPVCDLATEPANPSLGIRSFGDDPAAVAALVGATVRGLQAEGVAATAKHFPGKGEAAVDSHHAMPVVRRTREEMLGRELVPFRAAIDAGVRLVMSGHFAAPALGGDEATPGTLSQPVMTALLRHELGFDGVAITDALDMRALGQGPLLVVEALAALAAGNDLLLATPDIFLAGELAAALEQAELRGLVAAERVALSRRRLAELRSWLAGIGDRPGLEVVGCAEHRALAAELAARAITLVRDEDGLLPLRLAAEATIGVVMPRPSDLTPADTSSFATAGLGAALRSRHARARELVVEPSPTEGDTRAALELAGASDVLVVGTISAALDARQAELVGRLLGTGKPAITIALRTPWDLAAYPQARTHLCSFGLLPPSLVALSAAMFGDAPIAGRLPVTLGRLYPRGHGLAR
ncbi:MAG TPA: glycoside hydrolase family 3 N-terminal domain-containing protein, partial [Candidatus Limnocylindrales bacterium]